MPACPEAAEPHWSLDRRIPLALIFAMAGQIIVALVAAALFVAEVREHDRRIERLEVADNATAARSQQLGEAVARLQETTLTLREAVTDLRQALRGR